MIKNTLSFIIRAGGAGVVLVFTYIYSRLLDTSIAQELFLTISIAFIVATISKMGGDIALMKYIATKKIFKKRLLGLFANLVLKDAAISLLVATVTYFVLSLITKVNLLLLPLTPLLVFIFYYSELFRGKGKTKHSSIIQFYVPYTLLLLCLFFFRALNKTMWVNWDDFSAIFITIPFLGIAIWLLSLKGCICKKKYRVLSRKIRVNGRLYFYPQLYNVLVMWAPVLLMSAVFNDHEVVEYTLLIRIASMISFTGICFNYIFFPQIARLINTNNFQPINQILKRYNLFTALIAITTIIFIGISLKFNFDQMLFNKTEERDAFIILLLANIIGLIFLPYLNISSLLFAQKAIINTTLFSFLASTFLYAVAYGVDSKYLFCVVVPLTIFLPHILFYFRCIKTLNLNGNNLHAI
jgi:O-antigen/teichoic acid export membrane protein